MFRAAVFCSHSPHICQIMCVSICLTRFASKNVTTINDPHTTASTTWAVRQQKADLKRPQTLHIKV
eukprot:1183539-Prorocentrum_minimum.AAC.4